MPNLSALAPITTAATALSNLVLVTPQEVVGYQPQNPPDPSGDLDTRQQPPTLVFNYEGEQSVTLQSDITDHYIEDNTAVADQIALKPEVVNTQGYIGELNDVVPGFLKPVKFVADKLTTIGAYEPSLSTTALLAYSEAFFLYQVAANVANSAVAAWSSIANAVTGSAGQAVIGSSGLQPARAQNKQQAMFQQFYGYWRSRTLFTVQTPWAVFQNMAIASLTPTQDAETRVITEFKVSFKMIRIARTQLAGNALALNLLPPSRQGRAATQSSSLTDLGTSSGTPGPSLGSQLSVSGLA